MTDAALHSDVSERKVLRIVDGRLKGKEYPLSSGDRLCIGHGLANDVVLRGAGTRNSAIELRLSGDTAAVRVIEGKAELLGRTLCAEDNAVLPSYLPFRFGEFVLAHGKRGSDRWEEVATLANTPCVTPVAPLPAPRLTDRVVTYGRGQLERARDRLDMLRLAIAAVSLTLLAAAVGPVGAMLEERAAGVPSLESRLGEAGFTGLAVTENPAGGLIVSGMVAEETDIIRLRSLVADHARPVMVDVISSASIASAATDILLAQGVEAKAAPAGLAGIAIAAPFLPADRRDELSALLKRDLPGLTQVTFRVDNSLGANPLQSFFANSSTGLASVIDDPGHIVTTDGARWFPGAVLPTGHRLLSVGGGRVRFEKDGRIEEIHL